MSEAPVNLVVDPETGRGDVEERSEEAAEAAEDRREKSGQETKAAEAAPAVVEDKGPPLVAAQLPFSIEAPVADAPRFGDMDVCRSQVASTEKPSTIKALQAGENAWVRCRVANVRSTGRAVFLVLRSLDDAAETLQACYFKDKADPRSNEASQVS